MIEDIMQSIITPIIKDAVKTQLLNVTYEAINVTYNNDNVTYNR